jgi:NTF2 fold immunity protein
VTGEQDAGIWKETMRKTKIAALILFGIPLGIWAAQLNVSDKDWIEYDRRLASHQKTVFPPGGLVPNEETAKAIATAVAIPIWGKGTVEAESPLKAGLKGNIWTVIGDPHIKGGQVGGELIVQIDKRNGAVLSILHTQ